MITIISTWLQKNNHEYTFQFDYNVYRSYYKTVLFQVSNYNSDKAKGAEEKEYAYADSKELKKMISSQHVSSTGMLSVDMTCTSLPGSFTVVNINY